MNLTIRSKLCIKPEDSVRVILEETAGGNPAHFITAFKEAGIKVLYKCTAVRFALKAEQLGADAIGLTGSKPPTIREKTTSPTQF